MTTIFTPNLIAGAVAYFFTNMLINDTSHGWEGVLAGALVSGLVGALNVQRGEERATHSVQRSQMGSAISISVLVATRLEHGLQNSR